MDTLKPLIISIIRTAVMPLVAGGVLAFILLLGVDNPSLELEAAVGSLLAMAWYIAARLLESKNRYWGVMLGVAVQPNYDDHNTEEAIINSVKRTVVPLVVGWAITFLVQLGVSLDTDTLAVALQAVITSAYYGALRLIEPSQPRASLLLGGSATPTY